MGGEEAGKGGSSAAGRDLLCQMGYCGRVQLQPMGTGPALSGHLETAKSERLKVTRILCHRQNAVVMIMTKQEHGMNSSHSPKSEETGHLDDYFLSSLLYLRNFKNPETSRCSATSWMEVFETACQVKMCTRWRCFPNPHPQCLSNPGVSKLEPPNSLDQAHSTATTARTEPELSRGHGNSRKSGT